MTKFLLALLVVSGSASSGGAQEPQHTMPPGMTHEEHLRQLQKDANLRTRGAAAMGFDQETTVHRFVLKPDGGAIDVRVKRSSDRAGRDQIRAHLQQIAKVFAAGDFAAPLATHGELPPGADTMRERGSTIAYLYEKTSLGGRVRIATNDPAARLAVHDFSALSDP